MANNATCGEKYRHRETDMKGVDDRFNWAHGKGRQTSRGGEKHGKIKSERGRWRKVLGGSERRAVITYLSSF